MKSLAELAAIRDKMRNNAEIYAMDAGSGTVTEITGYHDEDWNWSDTPLDDGHTWQAETHTYDVEDTLLLEHLGGNARIALDAAGTAHVTVNNNGKLAVFFKFCRHIVTDGMPQAQKFHIVVFDKAD